MYGREAFTAIPKSSPHITKKYDLLSESRCRRHRQQMGQKVRKAEGTGRTQR